jgi:hypothetical protein
MTAVVETFRKYAVVGDLKFVTIQTSSACDTGHTIDLNSDVADGRGAVFTEVLHTIVHDDAGLIEEATFAPATGIVTMGTLTGAGIHNITIIGY